MTGLRVFSCFPILVTGAAAAEMNCFRIHTSRDPGWVEFVVSLLLSPLLIVIHSTWSQGLLVVVAFLLGYLAHRFRLRSVHRALNALFQKSLSERVNCERGLNDTLLQTIEASKLIADNALEPSADSVRMREALGRLSYWLGQATQEGQAAIHALGTTSNYENDLASGFRRAAEECLKQSSMGFSLSVIGQSKELLPMIRDEVYLLGYDVISSACKHSNASHLEVSLTYGREFCLQVTTNGRGPDSVLAQASSDGTLDLYELERRARRFGGMVSETKQSESTVKICLTVPGSIIFQKTPAILPGWTKNWMGFFKSRSGEPD